MKKYLISFVAATALILAFTGCSKSNDLYNQGIIDEKNKEDQAKQDQQNELAINEAYATAFEKAFGPVGSNVDWGFSRKSSGARAFTRDGGVAFNTDILFPGDCDANNFLADVPAGVSKLNKYGSGAGSWYIDEAYEMVQTYGGASKLYVKGDIDLSEGDTNYDYPRLNLSTTSELYLLEGSTLKIGQVSAERLVCAAIYIAEGATLTTDYPILLNSGMDVYNHGTINVKDDLQVNTNSILYNSGTVKATGTVSAESIGSDGGQSFIVNNGTIECAEVVVNGGAVKNDFKWTVSGTTKINSNNSGWINTDHWKTGNYAYVAGSENVINSCFLEVDNDFDMNVSSLSATGAQAFKMNSGGSVVTTNFYGGRDLSDNVVKGGPFRINMAEYSLFKVTNKATLESGRGPMSEGEVGFGFFGPSTGGYAVFQAKDIVRDTYLESIKSHGAVTYGGNLWVYAETHFDQGYDSDGTGTYGPRPFIFEQGTFSIANNIYAAGFKSGKPSITIPQTTCSPGFQGGDPLYRVIAEDLSASEAGDFDFNDVVFDVVKAEGGVTTLKLICAGGVLPLRVRGANQAEGTEIHSLFGENEPNANGQYKMYNTGLSPKMPEAEFTVEGTYTTPEQIRNIIIEVWKDGNWRELTATRGKAACKILVDDTFKPVEERRNIADENQNFTNYVQGKFVNDFWWK